MTLTLQLMKLEMQQKSFFCWGKYFQNIGILPKLQFLLLLRKDLMEQLKWKKLLVCLTISIYSISPNPFSHFQWNRKKKKKKKKKELIWFDFWRIDGFSKKKKSLGYGYGYVLYTTQIQLKRKSKLKISRCQDRALVYVDRKFQGIYLFFFCKKFVWSKIKKKKKEQLVGQKKVKQQNWK